MFVAPSHSISNFNSFHQYFVSSTVPLDCRLTLLQNIIMASYSSQPLLSDLQDRINVTKQKLGVLHEDYEVKKMVLEDGLLSLEIQYETEQQEAHRRQHGDDLDTPDNSSLPSSDFVSYMRSPIESLEDHSISDDRMSGLGILAVTPSWGLSPLEETAISNFIYTGSFNSAVMPGGNESLVASSWGFNGDEDTPLPNRTSFSSMNDFFLSPEFFSEFQRYNLAAAFEPALGLAQSRHSNSDFSQHSTLIPAQPSIVVPPSGHHSYLNFSQHSKSIPAQPSIVVPSAGQPSVRSSSGLLPEGVIFKSIESPERDRTPSGSSRHAAGHSPAKLRTSEASHSLATRCSESRSPTMQAASQGPIETPESSQSVVRSNNRPPRLLFHSLTTHSKLTVHFIADGVIQDGPPKRCSYMQNRHALTSTTVGQLIRFLRRWKHSRSIGLTVVDKRPDGRIVPLDTFWISDEGAQRTLKELLWLTWVE